MPATVTPLVYAIPVQLIAYHTAVVMGIDVDQPRNLAKIGDRGMSKVRPVGVLGPTRLVLALKYLPEA
jgi:hypothetical protein